MLFASLLSMYRTLAHILCIFVTIRKRCDYLDLKIKTKNHITVSVVSIPE
jgi:hypothetical protein